MKTNIKNLSLVTLFLMIVSSCELERLDAATEAAPGGGTLSEYTAYTIDSTDPDGSNVFGRIVFWKTPLDQTLIQVSLYNTIDGLMHPALLLQGASGTSTTTLLELDDVSGSSGEFSTDKFVLIPDTSFYESIEGLDANVSIFLSDNDNTIVASGDIGMNAMPVDSN